MIPTRQDCDPSVYASGDEPLAELLEQVAASLKVGESVSLDEIVAQFPEQEAEIRDLYPTIAAMVEMARDAPGQSSHSHDSLFEAGSIIARPGRHRLGDFQIIREVGRGGMGVVYEAEQLSLGRRVALKVLPFAAMLDERLLKRFKNEARSAATLEHPHIVAVHFIGCERGIHFFAMQFVDGLTLEEVVLRLKAETVTGHAAPLPKVPSQTPRKSNPFDQTAGGGFIKEPRPPISDDDSSSWLPGDAWESSRRSNPIPAARPPARADDVTGSLGAGGSLYQRIAQLAAQAADAVEHAHQQRIIHRDLKPSNLMLDEHGHIWVTDFGLATTYGDSNLTLTGDLIGTLRYSSPEQASGGAIDHRTDIYSLGITLYELLALVPAFSAKDRHDLLDHILRKEPRRLRQVKKNIPVDLEVIVHKAISKDPQERYQTAREFADDLRRFLSHQPIKAKPPAAWEAAAKWVRRRPGVALLAVLASVAALAVSVALSIYTVQLRWAYARLEELNSETLRNESQMHRSLQYPSNITVAAGAIDQRDFETARLALAACIPAKPGVADPCGFEWHLLQNRVRTPPLQWTFAGTGSPMLSVAVSPDGQFAATGDKGGVVSLWDLQTGQRHKSWRPFAGETQVRFSPRGTWLAAASDYQDGRVVLWNMQELKEAANFVAHDGTLYALAFTPDEKFLATGGREEIIKLWKLADVTAGKYKPAVVPTPLWQVAAASVIYDLQFSPDGSWLISAEKQERLRIWKTADGSPRETICQSPDGASFQACCLLDQGRICAAGGYSDKLRLFYLPSRRELASLDCGDGIYDIAVSRDEKMVAAACDDGSVHLWRLDGPELRQVERICFVAHQGRIRKVAFTPDGRSLLTASDDGTAKIWKLDGLPAPDLRLVNLRTPGGVHQVRCAPQGNSVATLGHDGRIQILSAQSDSISRELSIVGKPLSNPCFSLAGDHFAATSRNEVFAWRTSDWSLSCSFKVPGDDIQGVSFGKHGTLLVLNSVEKDSGRLSEWKIPTGKPARSLSLGRDLPLAAVCSPTGGLLAVSVDSDKLLLIDLDLFVARPVQLPVDRMMHLAFSRDGKRLAAANEGNTFCLVDARGGRLISYHRVSASDISGVAFTQDNRLLAVSDLEQRCVHVFDLETTRVLFALDAMHFRPRSLTLSPNGRFLFAATREANSEGLSGVLEWDLMPCENDRFHDKN
ncbi:MAG: protein kinase domain-containing protein [Pirellulaceae bacterium]